MFASPSLISPRSFIAFSIEPTSVNGRNTFSRIFKFCLAFKWKKIEETANFPRSVAREMRKPVDDTFTDIRDTRQNVSLGRIWNAARQPASVCPSRVSRSLKNPAFVLVIPSDGPYNRFLIRSSNPNQFEAAPFTLI